MAASVGTAAAPTVAPSSGPPGAVIERAGLHLNFGSDVLKSQIDELKAEQASQRAKRKKVNKDLRNCEKRRQRLKKRAKMLSDDDLIAVLRMRAGSGVSRSSDVASSSSGVARSEADDGAAAAAEVPPSDNIDAEE